MQRLTAVLIFCSVVGLSGCGGETTGPVSNSYTQALDKAKAGWQGLKTDYGDDYRYVVNAAAIAGPSFETTLTVQDNKVVQRDLVVTAIDEAGNTTTLDSWSETDDTLGSHDEGAELQTIDERYAACKAEFETTDPAQNDIDLGYIVPINAEPTEKFVLASCLILPKGAVYDGGAETVISLEFSPFKND